MEAPYQVYLSVPLLWQELEELNKLVQTKVSNADQCQRKIHLGCV